jgi:hypothetical protein
MGNNTSIVLSNIKNTKINSSSIIVYKHKYFKGNYSELSYRKKSYIVSNIGIDNNSISSLIIGPNTIVTLYGSNNVKLKLINKTVDKDYYYNDLSNRTNKFAYWSWDNIITKIKVSIFNNNETEELLITPADYIMKINIGNNTYKFDYGSYHHIWLNTNEMPMKIDISIPTNKVRIEFWTGFHPSQGRRILLDRTNNTYIENKGIIRSVSIIPVIHLNKKNIKLNRTFINDNDISRDYQTHELIRNNQIKKRDVYFTDYSFDKQGQIIEIFDNINNCNYRIYFIIVIIFLLKLS